MSDSYCPKRGEIAWLTFTPQAGHEQAGHRPALIISPEAYNKKVGLALVCPITSQVKGYPFEVAIPQGFAVSGVVLADQLKSVDWKARGARYCCTVPVATVSEVLAKLAALIES
ncbi:MAG: endoribonuclease MazF [Candidatus Omnitrophica bacterium]|nr:endoribonuclease MazF [Candidatus Omnitrophota bacterium]